MVFFKNKDDNVDDWKEKYLQLLDSQEQSENQHKTSEELFCKTMVRFALAVKGFDPSLDPHLDRIRNQFKSGLRSQQLVQELQIFSSALMALEDTEQKSSQINAALLFDFLAHQFPGQQHQLDQIQQRYDNKALINPQQLFIALAELIADAPQQPHDLATELSFTDCKALGQQLIHLLENAEFPEAFADDANQLKNRLQSGQALVPVFDDTVTLLLSVKKHLENEQQELAAFLAMLTEDLAELSLKASGVNIATEDSIKKRSILDRDVTAQMDDLQKKSATATQLDPLKQLIHVRLAGICQQIHAHTLQEQVERERIQHELRSMTQKALEMESQTVELQTRLEVAQRRATRDPLTNLANRQAFEDRLSEEIARSRRSHSALSMIIWDIDFFKNINDTYGHKSGDKALVIISKLLTQCCRKSDFLARFGGEEFVMLLPETNAEATWVVAEKLREAVAKSSFSANGNRVSITLSGGIAELTDKDNSESFFERADSALYKAKQSGRNQCAQL